MRFTYNLISCTGNANTTIQTPDEEVVIITLYPSSRLLEVGDGWFIIRICMIRCARPDCVHDTYRPSQFSNWQQYLIQLFRTRNLILGDTFTKRSGKLRCWQIIKISFNMRFIYNLISCNILLFDSNLFNFIALNWFNCFSSDLLKFLFNICSVVFPT